MANSYMNDGGGKRIVFSQDQIDYARKLLDYALELQEFHTTYSNFYHHQLSNGYKGKANERISEHASDLSYQIEMLGKGYSLIYGSVEEIIKAFMEEDETIARMISRQLRTVINKYNKGSS